MRNLLFPLFALITQAAYGQLNEIEFSADGIIFPRYANVDMLALQGVQGQCVYNVSIKSIFCFDGADWKNMNSSTKIFDSNLDTGIETELNAGDDKLRFYAGNSTEVMIHDGKTLHMLDNGESVFIGAEAGKFDDGTDNRNSYLGHHAGQLTTSGANNVAMGNQALRDNSSGNNNVAIGKQALFKNVDSNNLGIGLNAGLNSVTGQKNVLIGGYAGADNATGKRNTLIGYEAGRASSGGNPSGNVMIGHQAGLQETQSDRLYIANDDTDVPLIYGEFDNKEIQINGVLSIGDVYQFPTTDGSFGEVLTTDGAGNIIWEESFVFTDTVVHLFNHGISDLDGDTYVNTEVNPDEDLIRFGIADDEVMMHDGKTLHIYNNGGVLIGEDAGTYLPSFGNTFIGNKAGEGIADNSTGTNNVGIGKLAGRNTTSGSQNTFLGVMAGENVENGNSNIAIGYDAGQESSGDNNIAIGRAAGRVADGNNNIFIGRASGGNVEGSYNIFIGSDDATYANVSHRLFIGTDITSELIYGEFDNKIFRINGDFEISPKDGIGTNSRLRMADSQGNMDEVIRRSGTDNTVVIGDVNNNGGSLHLRAAGITRLTVTPEGSVRYVPMANPPGTCGTSLRGQVYYDSDDDKLKVCGKNFAGIFAWQNMH